jgi:hypothetical protein
MAAFKPVFFFAIARLLVRAGLRAGLAAAMSTIPFSKTVGGVAEWTTQHP